MIIGVDARVLIEGSGGVRVYAEAVLRHMIKSTRGHEWKLFINTRSTASVFINELETLSNVRVYRYRFPSKFLNASFRFRRWPYIDSLVGGCDVLFFPTILYSAWSKDVPAVLTMHDLSFEIVPECFTRTQNLWHHLVRPRSLCEQAKAVVAVSESTRRDIIERYGIDEKRVHAVHHGLGTQFRPGLNSTTIKALRERYHIPDGPIILQAGTIEPRKNTHMTLAAFEAWNDREPDVANAYVLIFAGHRGWKSKQFYQAVARSKYASRVAVIHEVPASHLPALYSAASAFVYPSLYEGFGFPIIEAMACGTPVITAPHSSLGEIAHGAAHYVHPYHPEELVEAFSLFARDPEYIKDLRSRGLERTTHFSWEKTAQRTLSVIESTQRTYAHRH